jgi:Flp pilus assembly protein CpaB
MNVAVAKRGERIRWANGRVLVGLALFLGSFIGGQRLLTAADTTVHVWAARTSIPAGTPLEADQLTPMSVKLPGGAIDAYVSSDESVEGAVSLRTVEAGELLPRQAISAAGVDSTLRSITIPVTPEHAVGGDLKPGDRVDVLATFDGGDVRARTVILSSAVQVTDVLTGGGLALTEDALLGVTVQVSPKDAARLAFAIRTAEIELARTAGPSSDTFEGSITGSSF